MLTVEEQRKNLIESLQHGFNLSDQEAAGVAEALKRDGELVWAMSFEIMVGHSRLKSKFDTLARQLQDFLTSQGVAPRWIELLSDRIRPQWKYIHYILRNDETYGAFALAEVAP